ncbi:MAG: ATP-binding protein [Balneolales bacterium]
MLFVSVSPGYSQVDEVDSSDITKSYVYDRTTGEFWFVPNSAEGIDSLLSISYEERNRAPEKAAYAAFQALNMAELLGYDEGMAQAYFALGELYDMFMDYPQALVEYQSALDLERRLQRDIRIGRVLNKIGMVHIKQGEYVNARDYFEQTISLLDDTSYDLTKAGALSALGLAHYHSENYSRALEYFDQVQALEGRSEDLEKIKMVTVMNAGNTYVELSEYERAESLLNQAIRYFSQHDDVTDQSEGHLYMATLYRQWNKPVEALVQARQGMDLAESIEENSLVMKGYQLLSGIYEDQNNPQQALLNYKLYHDLHNQVLNSEREARLVQRQTQHDVAQQNREIRQLNQETILQEAELENKELWQRFLIVGLGLAIIIALLLIRNIRMQRSAHQRLEQKQSEIERKNKELAQLNQEKDEFLEMAAHDLRNPLSAIRGVVGLMEEAGEPDADTLELTNLIKISTDRMLGLVNNFLNVEVGDKGPGTLNIIPVHIEKTIRRITGNFRNKTLEKQIKLAIDLPRDLRPVMADEDSLERILENLVSNAIKFSPSGSTVEIFSITKESHMDISVKDSGPGITAVDQEKLFKRFSTLSNKPTANESSTGLGLYIVKKFTEAMGGHVHCESKPGKGSTFTVSLPLATDKSTPGNNAT